jgi:hypothetical protein
VDNKELTEFLGNGIDPNIVAKISPESRSLYQAMKDAGWEIVYDSTSDGLDDHGQ